MPYIQLSPLQYGILGVQECHISIVIALHNVYVRAKFKQETLVYKNLCHCVPWLSWAGILTGR
jgi:hypothetical protein